MSKTGTKAAETTETKVIVVYGVDQDDKPRAARFSGTQPDLVTKAVQAMDLSQAEVTTRDQAEVAKKLTAGRLYANGSGFVPYIRRDLYHKVLAAFCGALPADTDPEATAVAVQTGLPTRFDEIAPGHLVIAQETLECGWWESIVIARDGDMLTLRFRDYPKYPKFKRHLSAIALLKTDLAPQPQAGD